MTFFVYLVVFFQKCYCAFFSSRRGFVNVHTKNRIVSPQLLLMLFYSVMFPDDKNIAVGCWDSRTGEKLQSLSSGIKTFSLKIVYEQFHYEIKGSNFRLN